MKEPLLPPDISLPGVTHAVYARDLPGKTPGLDCGVRPKLKVGKVLEWLMAQLTYANKYRAQVKQEIRAERKKKKADKRKARRAKRRSHSSGSSYTESDTDSSSSGFDGAGADKHTFRELGREQPGVLFASITSDYRAQLGSRGMDQDVGPQGPVFRKWHDSCLLPRVPHNRPKAKAEEILTLVTALDDYRAGRLLEVGDILATRLRMLVYGVENDNWGVAEQFLSYPMEESSLVPSASVKEALKLERAAAKHAKDMAAAGRNTSR